MKKKSRQVLCANDVPEIRNEKKGEVTMYKSDENRKTIIPIWKKAHYGAKNEPYLQSECQMAS